MWIKINQSMGDDWQYMCRIGLPFGQHIGRSCASSSRKRWDEAGFLGASLDHSMWFHRCCRADEWLLFEQQVAWTGDGRGLLKGASSIFPEFW
ncbi:MAG: hypothetical protein CM1200mP24_05060 [Gammaproteobacteria bacterium]|nr:MAG: hypothetical protein CM1200mP24_05060 [Gammaproteobacteria bacterium]